MYAVAKYGDCVGMKEEDSILNKGVQMMVRRDGEMEGPQLPGKPCWLNFPPEVEIDRDTDSFSSQ